VLLLLPLGVTQAASQQDEKRAFAERLTSLSNFVLKSAEVAASRGQEQSVKSFAETVRTEMQQRFGVELVEAIEQEGLDPSPELSQEYQNKLQALGNAAQNQFDNAYFSAQVLALESMIELMANYQETAGEGALKTFAGMHVGGLRTLYIRAQEFSAP
jgi:putative membrane protein